MGNRKHHKQSQKKKALKKQHNKARQEARLARKALKEAESSPQQCTPNQSELDLKVFPQKITPEDLWIEKNSLLSSYAYSVFSISSADENVAYLGVFNTGTFNYSVISDAINKYAILKFIKAYIIEELNLLPVENSKQYQAQLSF